MGTQENNSQPGFFERWRARRKALNAKNTPQATGPDTGLPTQTSATDRKEMRGPVEVEIRRYEFAKWQNRLLIAATIALGISMGAMMLTGWFVRQRPQMTLVAPDSLSLASKQVLGSDAEVTEDDLLLYLNSVLPLMHRIDDRGSPDVILLQGMVSPVIYEEIRAEAAKVRKVAQDNLIIQNLVITSVEDVVVDKERGRVSAYVKGYLAIMIQSRQRQAVLPYRTEVLLEMSPPSRLNRFPFVLLRREWKSDKAALNWDTTRKPGGGQK